MYVILPSLRRRTPARPEDINHARLSSTPGTGFAASASEVIHGKRLESSLRGSKSMNHEDYAKPRRVLKHKKIKTDPTLA